ncbi:MAG: hypothetical protein RIT35_549, partial [Pseudomonadota bacterium]
RETPAFDRQIIALNKPYSGAVIDFLVRNIDI